MNRRIRNRTYGGVGGREPRGSLLPDYSSRGCYLILAALYARIQFVRGETMSDDGEIARRALDFQAPGRNYSLSDLPGYDTWSERKSDEGESPALIAHLDATSMWLLPETPRKSRKRILMTCSMTCAPNLRSRQTDTVAPAFIRFEPTVLVPEKFSGAGKRWAESKIIFF
jgi:hypothetical protein